MGVSGAAIFSDDVACDVRDAYKQLIADGCTGEQATDALLADWLKDTREEDEDVLVFWLALAATQSTLGRLEDRVRDRAIAIIDSGRDLARAREVGKEAKRAAVLAKLREQLLGPQPAPKKVRVQRLYNPPCQAGDFLAFRLTSGRWVVWHVLDVNDAHGVSCVALDYIGDEIPEESLVLSLPVKTMLRTRGATDFSVATYKKRDLPLDRLQTLPVHRAPKRRPTGGLFFFWDAAEITMKDIFGWE